MADKKDENGSWMDSAYSLGSSMWGYASQTVSKCVYVVHTCPLRLCFRRTCMPDSTCISLGAIATCILAWGEASSVCIENAPCTVSSPAHPRAL
jgi:hypothetical protein